MAIDEEGAVKIGGHHTLRKPIVLIGAPSGAGKTVLSQQIIAGTLPLFNELCGSPGSARVRHDLKLLPMDLPRDQTLIIECPTHKFERFTGTEQWSRMLELARESEKVICVNLCLSRRALAQQYFVRIFTGPKRMHMLYRVIQVSKYKNTLMYLLSRQLSRSNKAWRSFATKLSEELQPRVVIVRAQRSGSGYDLTVEATPAANSSRPAGAPL